ncbi:hypothetical protein KKG24_05070 [Patescibacteria group bacterium]|nr:hypothetical protein [Patescibacteria group bacterium]
MFILATRLYAEEYSQSAEALFSFGEAYLKEDRYADAEMELKKCLMLNPQHAQAKLLLEKCEKQIALKENKTREDAVKFALEETEKKIKKQELTTPTAVMPEKEESLAPPIQKGAWTQQEGQLYTELYTKYFWHNHQFNNDRKKKRWDYDGKGDSIRTELKLEYGLTDTDTLLLSTVAVEMHWKDSFRSNTKKGFTEVKAGIKHLLFTEPFICSVQQKVKFPLHYSEQAIPALDKHQIDAETRILTAQLWPKLPGYTKFETGFKFRAEEPSNEIPYFFEFGYNLFPSLILKTTLDGQTAVGAGMKEDLLKYTLGPIFKIKDLLNIEFSYGHTFAGRNTSAGKEVITTLSRQW